MLIEVASYIPLFRPLEVLLDEYSIQSLLEKRKEFITQIPAAINVINSNEQKSGVRLHFNKQKSGVRLLFKAGKESRRHYL